MSKKICGACKRVKLLTEFYTYTYVKGGKLQRRYMKKCKLCTKIERCHRSQQKNKS